MINSSNPFFDTLRDVQWGKHYKHWQISEVYTPSKEGPLTEILAHYTEGILVNPWLTVLIGLGRTLRQETPEEIFAQLKSKFDLQYSEQQATPLQQVLIFLHWLAQEQDKGILKRCTISFELLVKIDETRLWVCRAGSNGILLGNPNSLRFVSTDLRWAEIEHRSSATFKEIPPISQSNLVRNILSPIDFNHPQDYESLLVEFKKDTVMLMLGQGALPFGRWPSSPLDVTELWSLDAGWKHGLAAHGIIIAEIEMDRVGWPHDLRIIDGGA